MFAPLPDSAVIKVEESLARDLLAAAERLPRYENQEFYSTELQAQVRDHLREGCRGFEEVIRRIQQGLSQWPYCVLVQGLLFDEGNKVFVGVSIFRKKVNESL